VDLAVLCQGRLPLDERLSLLADATQLLGRDVDLVDLRAAPLVVRGRIVRDGREVLVRDRDQWVDFVSRAMMDWLDFEPAWLRGIATELSLLREGRSCLRVARPRAAVGRWPGGSLRPLRLRARPGRGDRIAP
jgi:hypothetical protein